MPPTLINRFDLVFSLRDVPNRSLDEKIARHILTEHQKEAKEMIIDRDLFRKYVAYAKQRIKPELTDEAVKKIKDFYVNLRNMETVGEPGIKPIPITARQLEALVRLSEGSARVKLSKQVTKLDAKRAINILKHCLMAVGFDYETQTFDIDRIATGISATQRSHMSVITEIISQLKNKIGDLIPIEDITAEAKEKGIAEDRIEELIQKMKINSKY